MIKSVRGVVRFYYDVEIEVPYGVCESEASLNKRLKGKAMDAPAECIIERGVYVLDTDNIQEVDVNGE